MKLKEQMQHLMAIVFALMLVLPVMAQNSKNPKPKVQTKQKNGVYTVADVVPTFPGGNKAMYNYLAKNVKYPKADLENNRQGKTIVQFVVEPDGSLTDVKALRSPSHTMGEEAVRVLKNSPKWKPGKVNGKAVRALFTIPVNFAISAEG